jgi:site-specific DNA-methyltransferase (adenine-specific)
VDWKEKFLDNVVQGDCVERLKEIPDNSVDLIVTSPPYNCGIKYDSYDDNRDWQDYLKWCHRWVGELQRVMKPDGRICLNVLIDMGLDKNKKRVSPFSEFDDILRFNGIKSAGTAFWTDNHRIKYTAWGSWRSASAPYTYLPYEVIMIGYKEQWAKKEKGISTISKQEFMMGCSGLWKLRTQTQEFTKANFNTDLPELCIKLFSYKDDIILDPFMGSWTTAVAAKKLHRHFVGFEISKKYCGVGQQRVDGTTPIFEQLLIEENEEAENEMSQSKFEME